MVGPIRPQFVLFGSSIVQFSYSHQGWGAILSDLYSRKSPIISGSPVLGTILGPVLPNRIFSVHMLESGTLIKVEGPNHLSTNHDILLRGYAGWNSRCGLQVLDEVFPKDATVQPSLVIIYFGGNDSLEPHPSGLGAHVPLPEYVENMRKIAIHLKSLSEKTRIIFLTAPAISEAQITEVFGNCLGRSNESCRKYSEACVQLCQELGVKVIDLWKAIQQRDDWSTACFTDGIHLSSEGSNIVVKEILEVLKETDWEPNLHWRSLPTEFPEISPYIFVGPKGETAVKVSQLDLEWQTQWH